MKGLAAAIPTTLWGAALYSEVTDAQGEAKVFLQKALAGSSAAAQKKAAAEADVSRLTKAATDSQERLSKLVVETNEAERLVDEAARATWAAEDAPEDEKMLAEEAMRDAEATLKERIERADAARAENAKLVDEAMSARRVLEAQAADAKDILERQQRDLRSVYTSHRLPEFFEDVELPPLPLAIPAKIFGMARGAVLGASGALALGTFGFLAKETEADTSNGINRGAPPVNMPSGVPPDPTSGVRERSAPEIFFGAIDNLRADPKGWWFGPNAHHQYGADAVPDVHVG